MSSTAEITGRLSSALANRYAIEPEAEPQASTSVKHPYEGGAP